jgi:hypothetical protein
MSELHLAALWWVGGGGLLALYVNLYGYPF